MKLPVPYYSQFVDINDPFWMIRACGVTTLRMVTEYQLRKEGKVDEAEHLPDLISLCNEARDREGYHKDNGWVHGYLVMKAKELGVSAYRKEGLTTLDDIISFLKEENPVIVSVEKRVLEQTRFHMIVIVGYEEDIDGAITSLYYHEPESTNKEKGQFRVCDVATFMNYWRGKAIFVTK